MCLEQYDTEALKSKINIVDYVGQFIDIKPNGKNYWGLCPFHKEETPSFVVNEEKQFCHCFGCGISLDVIEFAKQFHHISFQDAVISLFAYIGEEAVTSLVPNILVTIKEFTPKKTCDTVVVRRPLMDTCLDGLSSEPVKEWLEEGISFDVLKKHKVGYDRVANSIAFPIYDSVGNIMALKHRTLDPDYKKKKMGKYIYSVPIGTLDTFYWYFQNIEEIYKKNEMIIVEGEKSVMKLESWGITNVVASMTSNLSELQLLLILKTVGVRDIVIAFDSDKDLNHIKKTFKTISSYKNFYVVQDWAGDDALLGPKDAPCDKGEKVWAELYEAKERIRQW